MGYALIGAISKCLPIFADEKAKTLASMSVVKVSGEQTALLYQRLIVVSQSGDISADEVMKL